MHTTVHSMCRTCLCNLQLDDAFDLFVVPDLVKKLCVCTSLSVEPQDGLPRNICNSCHSRLNDLHEFKKQCVDSVQWFKALVSKNCFINRSISEDETPVVNAALLDEVDNEENNIFDAHLNSKFEVDNDEDIFRMIDDVVEEHEDVDNPKSAFKDSVTDYNNENVNSSSSDYQVPLTRSRRSSRATKDDKGKDSSGFKSLARKKTKKKTKEKEAVAVMKVPMIPAEPKGPRRVEVVDMSQLAGTAINPLPSLSVSSWSSEKDFAKIKGKHICPTCSKNLSTKQALRLHIKEVHDKVKDFACRFCPKRFSKSYHLCHHEYIHTGEKPYECKVCHRNFRQISSLRKHMESHSRSQKESKYPKKPKTKPKLKNLRVSRVRLNSKPVRNYEL